jgi:hypothetical protein
MDARQTDDIAVQAKTLEEASHLEPKEKVFSMIKKNDNFLE